MRILESASCIAVIVSLVIAAVRTTIIDDDDGIFALERRHRRAVVATLNYTGCGHWSDWISRNTPNLSSSPNENEHFTKNDLDVLCPSAGGYTVNGFRCRDEKGEPIHDIINETDVSHTYVHTCSNMSATCVVLNSSNSKEKCPDFAIQIKCACPSTTSTSSSTIQTTSGTGGGSVTRNGTSGSGTGGGSLTGSGSVGSSTGGGSVMGSGTSGSGTGGGSLMGSGSVGGSTGGGSVTGSVTSGSGSGGGSLTGGCSVGSNTGGGSVTGNGTSGSGIAVIVSLVIAAVRTTIIDDDDGIFALKERHRRAAVATLNYTGCGRWSDWISRNTPNVSSSPNENEHFTQNDLDVLCPSAGGYTVNGFRCKDEKGEPIHDIINETDVSHTYVHTCSNMSATCFMINASNTKEKCPDFAIQIKCNCPPTTSTSSSTIHTTSGTGSGSVTGNGTSGSGTGGGSVTSTGGSGTGGGSVTSTGGSGTGGGSMTGNGTSGSGTGGVSLTGSGSVGSSTGGGSVTGNGTSGSGTGGGSLMGRGSVGGSTGGGSVTGNGTSESGTGGGSLTGSGAENGGNESSQSLSGSSTDGNLSLGGKSLPWWLIPLVVSLVLFVVNLILVLFVYKKLTQQIRNNQVGPI